MILLRPRADGAARPLFEAGVARRTLMRFGPIAGFYLLAYPAGELRNRADDMGFPVHTQFGGWASWVLSAAPTYWLQGSPLDQHLVQMAATLVYITWFMTPVFLAIPLILFAPERYWRFTLFILIPYWLAAPAFIVFPLEPPWMQHADITRIVTTIIPEANGVDPNPYAAMPSLHVALPMAAALWFGWRSAWGKCVFGYTALIAFVVVYTGDHYVADIAGGAALAVASSALVAWLRLPLRQPVAAAAAGAAEATEPPLGRAA